MLPTGYAQVLPHAVDPAAAGFSHWPPLTELLSSRAEQVVKKLWGAPLPKRSQQLQSTAVAKNAESHGFVRKVLQAGEVVGATWKS